MPDRATRRPEQDQTDPDTCRRAGKDLLERVVAPSLREFGHTLATGGLRAQVTVQDEERRPPRATLLVAPEGEPLDGWAAESITFQPGGPSGKVLVRSRTRTTGRSGGATLEGAFPPDDLTPEKVDELVFLFVQRLLGY
jgi:hypothetical protein